MTESIRGLFDDATAWCNSFGEHDANQLAQHLIDQIIKELRRDRRWSAISRLELELLLGDVQQQLTETLFERVGGYGPIHEALNKLFAIAADEAMAKPHKQ